MHNDGIRSCAMAITEMNWRHAMAARGWSTKYADDHARAKRSAIGFWLGRRLSGSARPLGSCWRSSRLVRRDVDGCSFRATWELLCSSFNVDWGSG
jgi:hypothetical protein